MGLRVDAQRQRFLRLRAFDHDADPTAWAQGRLAGVDEAGVGPLAAPVVAAAVILPADFDLPELYDSKCLSPAARQRCERAVRAGAIAFAVARVSPADIDRVNIANAPGIPANRTPHPPQFHLQMACRCLRSSTDDRRLSAIPRRLRLPIPDQNPLRTGHAPDQGSNSQLCAK